MRPWVLAVLTMLLVPRPGGAEEVDLRAIQAIKQEGSENSQVMDLLFQLTDVNGPRLTNSPGYATAVAWAESTLRSWGLTGGREPWGEFGRGWSFSRCRVGLVTPVAAPLVGIPLAWSGSTGGPVRAEVIYAPLHQPWEKVSVYDLPVFEKAVKEFMERNAGRLRERIVLLSPERRFNLPTEPDGNRLTAEKLAEYEAADPFVPPRRYRLPGYDLPQDPDRRDEFVDRAPLEIQADTWDRCYEVRNRLNQFLEEEGALAALTCSGRGSGSILFVTEAGSGWRTDVPIPLPMVALSPEHYARLVRLAERKIPAVVEMDVQTTFHEADLTGYNVIAEFPGTTRRNEVVMLGGHLDSWHAATGATDNAAGCAVAMEAVRILKALDLKMDRTVRIALWGGEEEGLYGSRGYVSRHFADPVTMKLKPEHARLSAYFNLDEGGGKIRGVYLQANDRARPLFETWLGALGDLGVSVASLRSSGYTDNRSFESVGLPGFDFIQDPMDYYPRTHHSSLDTYGHIVPEDVMQASVVLAAIVYHVATRPDLMPRKPLPKPLSP